MKANFKINTLRGIFFCLTRNKDGLCPRTVFSRTQKIKNVCLKRSFQFVGRRKLQIENPSPFARKEFAYFYAPFRSRPALFHFAKTRPAFAPLRFKKANTFLCPPPFYPLLQRRIKTKMKSGMIIYPAQVLSQS
jgi:hypothetical protein